MGVSYKTTTEEETDKTSVARSATHCPVTGNIALVCREQIRGDGSDPDDWKHHIVVYTDRLCILYHYRGTDIKGRSGSTPDELDPRSITYDSRGNVLIAVRSTNTTELISGEGHHIKTLHRAKDQGYLGVQTGDVLWAKLMSDAGEWELQLLQYYTD